MTGENFCPVFCFISGAAVDKTTAWLFFSCRSEGNISALTETMFPYRRQSSPSPSRSTDSSSKPQQSRPCSVTPPSKQPAPVIVRASLCSVVTTANNSGGPNSHPSLHQFQPCAGNSPALFRKAGGENSHGKNTAPGAAVWHVPASR